MKKYVFILSLLFCAVFLFSCENIGEKEAISRNVEEKTNGEELKKVKFEYDTPVAVFFQASSYNSFIKESEIYKETGSIFPDGFENNVDIIYYAFATVKNEKAILSINNGLADLKEMQKKGVKLILSIEATAKEGCQQMLNISSDDNKCNVFVDSCLDICKKYGFDGVDIDWEAISETLHPTSSGVNKIMKTLREKAGDDFYLSLDVPASKWGASPERFDFKTLNNIVDYVNLMSYDLQKNGIASHLCPNYSSELDNGYGFGAVYGLERLSELGLDKGKVLLGSASYGKAYCMEEPISSGKVLGKSGTLSKIDLSESYDTGTVLGKGISEALASDIWKYGEENTSDGGFVGSYLYCEEGDLFLTFDSNKAFAEKYSVAKETKGTGVMLWSYTTDPDLRFYNTIAEQK